MDLEARAGTASEEHVFRRKNRRRTARIVRAQRKEEKLRRRRSHWLKAEIKNIRRKKSKTE